MIDIKTGKENGHENSTRDNLLREGRFGIGNVKTLTTGTDMTNGSERYHSIALKEGMLGGIRSTDNTIVDNIGGSWNVIYNFKDNEDGTIEVTPIEEDENFFLEVK